MQKNLIIGCVTEYRIPQIYNWVKSIEKSGFVGDKMMIIYNTDQDTINFLESNGFKIIRSVLKHHIVVQRFFDIYRAIKDLDYKYIISTDVKDVIFQYDPVVWLLENLKEDKKVIVSSECLKYKDENWGKNNMKASYPHFQEVMMEKEIYNAGTIAGEFSTFVDFVKKVFDLSCQGFPPQPDQAALNIITHLLNPDIVRKTAQNEGWCAQLGTTMDSRVLNESGHLLTEEEPVWNYETMKMMTAKNKEFALVHQYDRIPQILEKINSIYK